MWNELRAAGFLHAAREAHTAATLAVFDALSRSAGFKDRSYGYTAFDVLESHLDRVFQVSPAVDAAAPGTAADTSPGAGGSGIGPHPAARRGGLIGGDVVRDDLNGSPGWRFGRYRIVLKRHEFGAVRAIRWDRDSPTKQAVARQAYPDSGDGQLALDIDAGPALPPPEVVTLVLAHSASEHPLEMELFLGRPRMNADGGPAWHWIRQLADETLGVDPRRWQAQEELPLSADDEADVPMRLHGVAGPARTTAAGAVCAGGAAESDATTRSPREGDASREGVR